MGSFMPSQFYGGTHAPNAKVVQNSETTIFFLLNYVSRYNLMRNHFQNNGLH